VKRTFEAEQRVARPRSEVFAFFSNAANLEKITPASLRFEILTPLPVEMRAGALIDYRIRLFGFPFHWRTLIESFEPESRFVDVQLRGPYRSWRHLHQFVDQGASTLMHDRVDYEVPFGPLGELAAARFVRGEVERIFAHRHKVIQELFG